MKQAANCASHIDDGYELENMLDIEHHRNIVSFVGRKLRIEHLGEQILDEVRLSYFLNLLFQGYMQEEIATYYI